MLDLKYVVLGQLRNYKQVLEEKIPRQKAEYDRNMAELNLLFADATKRYNDQLAALDKELKAATDATKLAQQQRDFYKDAYDVCVNAPKRSFGCWMKKLVSFGGWKCH